MAANVPAVMVSSTHVGRYVVLLQLYGKYFCASEGTIIRYRSSHIPMTTPVDAITVPVIVRNFLIASIGNGITKLHTTIVQKSGEYFPVSVSQKTVISADSFPYHVVNRSEKTK